MKDDILLYLPIKASSLAHYLNRALILPSVYLKNKIEDIQDEVNGALLLSKKKWTNDTNCALEINITEDEEREKIVNISDVFSLFNGVLPISRIKKVYFSNRDESATVAWNINNGAGFLPDSLIQIEDISENDLVTSLLSEAKNLIEPSDYSKKIKYFDHILGSLALMRVAGESYMNFSENYFATLSYFNEIVRNDVHKVEQETGRDFAYGFTDIYKRNEGKYAKWQSLFYNSIEIADVEAIASSTGLKLEKKLGQIQLDTIDSNSMLYLLSILSTYGKQKSKSIDNLISDVFAGQIPKIKQEEVLLLAGLNNGYASLRNKYRLPGFEKKIKYELANKLDFYTIESIFQFSFNGLASSSFPFIDSLFSHKHQNVLAGENYEILGQVVITEKFPGVFSDKHLTLLFRKNPPEKVYTLIYQAIEKWLPPFVQKNRENGETYFKSLVESEIEIWFKNLAIVLEKSNKSQTSQQQTVPSRNDDVVIRLKTTVDTLTQELNSLKKINEELLSYANGNNLSSRDLNSKPNTQNRDTLSKMNIAILRDIAKNKGLKPIPTKKEDLIDAILKTQTIL